MAKQKRKCGSGRKGLGRTDGLASGMHQTLVPDQQGLRHSLVAGPRAAGYDVDQGSGSFTRLVGGFGSCAWW